METSITHYPVYMPDQFLTSGNLNDTTQYLEHQERATRAMAIGNGIIHGLNQVTVTSAAGLTTGIQLVPGYGLSIEGYLLQTPGYCMCEKDPVTLRYATTEGNFFKVTIKKTDKHCYRQLITAHLDDVNEFVDEDENVIDDATIEKINCIELFISKPDVAEDKRNIQGINSITTASLSKYALVAFADIYDLQQGKCEQGDCNEKGTERNLKTRFLLVPLTLLDSLNSMLQSIPLVHTKRIQKIGQTTGESALYAKIKTAYTDSVAALVTSVQQISNNSAGYIDKTSMDVALARLKNIVPPSNAYCEYYLGFTADLSQAVNEYITYFNDFAEKYPVYSHSRIGRILVMANMNDTGAVPDKYRYYWLSAKKPEGLKYGLYHLRKLHERIVALITLFLESAPLAGRIGVSIGGSQTGAIKFIPSKEPHVPLGEKAVPYYYDAPVDGANGLGFWNAQTLGTHRETIFNYYASLPMQIMDLNISLYNFFRIEGHLGLSVGQAYEKCTSQIREQDIPIQVLKLQVGSPNKAPVKDSYDKFKNAFIANLNYFVNDPQNKIVNFNLKFPKFDELRIKLQQTSYATPADVTRILNDTAAYMGVINSFNKTQGMMATGGTGGLKAKRVTEGAMKSAAPQNWQKQEAQQVYDKFYGTQMQQMRKDLEKVIRDTNADNALSLGDLVGLEYLGGVYKGGTFVLIHNGQYVIGDASLPYYVEIDSIRVKK
ncbi:MAG: hypothetical protein J0I41_11720 [Filimonas sp.]|nr:hypothetical protein [Filimonas sp.]